MINNCGFHVLLLIFQLPAKICHLLVGEPYIILSISICSLLPICFIIKLPIKTFHLRSISIHVMQVSIWVLCCQDASSFDSYIHAKMCHLLVEEPCRYMFWASWFLLVAPAQMCCLSGRPDK